MCLIKLLKNKNSCKCSTYSETDVNIFCAQNKRVTVSSDESRGRLPQDSSEMMPKYDCQKEHSCAYEIFGPQRCMG